MLFVRTFLCLLLVGASMASVFGFRALTGGFKINRCLIEWPYMAEWETDRLKDQNVMDQLNSPFSYLGRGTQSYAFLSRDGKYVLKLFHFNTCPIPYGQICERWVRRWTGVKIRPSISVEERILKNFSACKWAYSLAKEQTGVIYAHLNLKQDEIPPIQIQDRLGRIHRLDPHRYRFVIQKRVETLRENFAAHPENIEATKQTVFALFDEISQLGLVNLDTKIGSNFGFADGRAIQIDFGNLSYSPDTAAENRRYFQRKYTQWLTKEFTK